MSAPHEQRDAVRRLLARATQQFLGATIALSDDDWHAPSTLPGWTRAHVGSHLARHDDPLTRLAEGALTGDPQPMYPGDRDAEIEAGAGRSGLELQEDLDTSAGRLDAAFERLDQADRWSATVEFRGRLTLPAGTLPLSRLAEVALHHVDLDLGYTIADIDPEVAAWSLQWAAVRLASRADCPALLLRPEGDDPIEFGPSADGRRTEVTGLPALLLGWLTGRTGPDGLTGADGLTLPSF